MSREPMGAAAIASAVAGRECLAVEVVSASLERIAAQEPRLNALITVMADRALERAARIDGLVASGSDPGPLAGVPVVVKDNLCTRGVRTTCGSRMLENWKPPYDAAVVEMLQGAGAVIVGKSNMDEFAMGSSSEHSRFGPVSNPRDPSRVPGGSSGGSAASVAAGYVPIALGSDTGGSIRQPAAFCGVHGFKPTYGSVSRWGLVAFASSLDQVGPFSRSVVDMALTMDVIYGCDPRDSTSREGERPRFIEGALNPSIKGMRIGVVREFREGSLEQPLTKAIEDAALALGESGCALAEVTLEESVAFGLPCYYIISPAEASSNLARFDGTRYGLRMDAPDFVSQLFLTRNVGFGDEVKRRILTGSFVLSSGYYDAFYATALKVRKKICAEFDRAFASVDVILMPTVPSLPFRKGDFDDDPVGMYKSDLFTLPVNLAGLPGMTVFTGLERSGLPTSVQIVAPRWQDQRLIECAAVIEEKFGRPPVAAGGCF
ncbi:MAG: Asp-tRNA(Asn)/Glu-tRNA(Gln) amidotransferase subunit GatA [Thermovirgaceae bacterium]